MKIAILVREETMLRCTGKGCLNAFFQRADAFSGHEGELELVAFSHAGGDIERKIEMMRKNGVEVVHLSSCMRAKAQNYEALAALLGNYFDVVGYTHGAPEGKDQATIFRKKDGVQR